MITGASRGCVPSRLLRDPPAAHRQRVGPPWGEAE
jgi:hypothetical protein